MVLYGACMLFILLYSLVQLHLAWLYRRYRRNTTLSATQPTPADVHNLNDAPMVTVQLPVYNEQYVVERLLGAVAKLKWPREKLEIQILDDSTDHTSALIEKAVTPLKESGLMIKHLHRTDRSGYKAGALQAGLQVAQGEYVAIFDADFVPDPDFLLQTIPHFTDANMGMVQTRWAHLNQNYSLLTRLQAFGLTGHFTIEQSARQQAGSFINFNGTAGVWKKKCIEDAGGWQSDTLTEDLDLSYRAQLKGWQFVYLEAVASPAELPVVMSAVKSQQFRWTKGGAETARKNLWKIAQSKMPVCNKVHAFFHLTNSTTFLLLLVASVVSIPLLYIKDQSPGLRFVFDLGSIFVIGFLAIAYFYWVATRYNLPSPVRTYITYFPLFLIFSMGLALHNGMAVLEGWLGWRSAFVRTPKFNIVGPQGTWKDNIYVKKQLTIMHLLEALLCVYFIAGVVIGITLADYGLVLFHFMLALGYGGVFYLSAKY